MLDHKESLFHVTGQLHRHIAALMREALMPFGLLPAQFTALAEIALKPGLTQAELALRLELEQPGVARTLAGLEEAGLVTRSTLKGRAQGLSLTETARTLLPEAQRAVAAAERQACAGMSRTEKAQLLDQMMTLFGRH